MKTNLIMCVAVLAVSACVGVMPEPVVTQYNGDSVTVRSLGLQGTAPSAQDISAAQNACGEKQAVWLSTVGLPNSFADFVFACR
jgi:hypothetical protein